MIEIVIVALFGLVFGSFLNVVIYRFDDWLSIIKTRSHCRDCKKQLSWFDLIPLISYISLKGKCRYCLKPISWQYSVVEAATAILLVAGYIVIQNLGLDTLTTYFAFGAYTLVVGVLIVIFFHDLYEMLISDYLNYFFIFFAFIYSVLVGLSLEDMILGVLVAVLPIALLVYPSRGKWMGEGDVKLAIGIGLLLGYPLSIIALISSFFLGGFLGGIFLLSKKLSPKSAIPFAPFLIAGTFIAFFFGENIVNWYLELIGFY